MRRFSNYSTPITALFRSLLLLAMLAALALPAAPAAAAPSAAPPADPYADAIHPSTSSPIINPNNAIGAPDGRMATVIGRTGLQLMLDMGQEGTGDLIITYGGVMINRGVDIEFFDNNQKLISRAQVYFSDLRPGTHATTVPYASAPKSYRYVRFISRLSIYQIDAIQDTRQTLDPYADTLSFENSELIVLFPLERLSSSQAAIGAPDNKTSAMGAIEPLLSVSLFSFLEASINPRAREGYGLLLDLGAGEDGTGDLIVYYRNTARQNTLHVLFDNEIADAEDNDDIQPLQLETNPTIRSIRVPETPSTYRYVFLQSAKPLEIDAIKATGTVFDGDGDGLLDHWETAYGLHPNDAQGAQGADGDPDTDGLKNAVEYLYGTDPTNADSDSDGLSDSNEISQGTDPTNADSDADGLNDGDEIAHSADPFKSDSDADGLPDAWEVTHNLNPKDSTGDNGAIGDPDGDDIKNADEYTEGTNPQEVNPIFFRLEPKLGTAITINTTPEVNASTTITLTNTCPSSFFCPSMDLMQVRAITATMLAGTNIITTTDSPPLPFDLDYNMVVPLTIRCIANTLGTSKAEIAISYQYWRDNQQVEDVIRYVVICNAPAPLNFDMLPTLTYGTRFGHRFSSGNSDPATYRIIQGSLPPGLTLNGTGYLSGIPIRAGSYSITVQASTGHSTIVQSTTLLVNKAPLSAQADHQYWYRGERWPALTVFYSGFVLGDTSAVVRGAPVCTTTATPNSAIANYPITCSIGTLAADNYAIASIANGTFGIYPRTLKCVSEIRIHLGLHGTLIDRYVGNGDGFDLSC